MRAQKILALPKWAPKKSQPSPKIYQPFPPAPPRPILYDHSLSGNSSHGNYIRKNRYISGILLNQEEIARIRYVGSLVTYLCFVWFLLCWSLWELPDNGVVKNLQSGFWIKPIGRWLTWVTLCCHISVLTPSVKYLTTISIATKLKLVWIGSNTRRNKNPAPTTNYR